MDDCAIEGVRIVEEAITQRAAFPRGLLQRVGTESRGTAIAPDRCQCRHLASSGQTLRRQRSPARRRKEWQRWCGSKNSRSTTCWSGCRSGRSSCWLGLQDPGNLGTILRSAEAFGSAGVVLGEGTVSPFNSKVIRASAGSVFRLPVILAKAAGGVDEISAKLRKQSVRLIATSSHKGTALDEARLTGSTAYSLGARERACRGRSWRRWMKWLRFRIRHRSNR